MIESMTKNACRIMMNQVCSQIKEVLPGELRFAVVVFGASGQYLLASDETDNRNVARVLDDASRTVESGSVPAETLPGFVPLEPIDRDGADDGK